MQVNDAVISRKVLFADPQRSGVKISPDGRLLAYLAPYNGILGVFLATVEKPLNGRLISQTNQPVKEIWWSGDGQYVLYSFDENGNENWQLVGYELASQKNTLYTPKGSQARILRISQQCPNTILIALNLRDQRFVDVHRLDLVSAKLECIYENQEYWDFYADSDLNLRFALKVNDTGGQLIDFQAEKEQVVGQFTLHDLFSYYFYAKLRLGYADKLQKLYLTNTLESQTSQLIEIDVVTHKQTVMAGNFQGDICDVLLDPNTYKPLACAHNFERKQWIGLIPTIEDDFAYLKTVDDGDIEIVSQSHNNQQWIVAFSHDDGPVSYYHYHRDLQRIDHLFESLDDLKQCPLTKMHTKIVKMRDGVPCVCYLSLPRLRDIKQSGRVDVPVPLILMVHGGPNYRDVWGYNPVHQWLANRGYAVLSINYRGSTGYGKTHFELGHGEWAGKMHLDLLDAANWAIENKITTKTQIAIMGRSYGGYATLVGLSMTPDVFCCGVDIVGPSNLQTMVKYFPPYWKAMQGAINEMVGCDPQTPDGQAYLKERSPLFYADHINKPLLIGHGANDVRVMQSESDQMVAALKQNNIPVTYVVFPDEGHQFLHPNNRMAFYALAEQFFAKILGGNCEPFDGNLNSTMIIKEDSLGIINS